MDSYSGGDWHRKKEVTWTWENKGNADMSNYSCSKLNRQQKETKVHS